MSDLPPPLVPPGTDLRDFQFMPLDIVRLFSSDFNSQSNDSEWRAGVTLWCKSWHQVPAASLPADDASLARVAEFGKDIRSWMRVRDHALRGWIKCSDGRLYHRTVAEKALEAWIEKLGQRKSSGAGNAKRWGGEFDSTVTDLAIATAAQMLSHLSPHSRTLQKKVTRTATWNPVCTPVENAHGSPGRNPELIPSGSQGTGTGTGTGNTKIISSLRSDTSAKADPQVELGIGSKPKATKPSSPNPDIRACVEIYNATAGPLGWARCEKMTKHRAAQMRQRLREFDGIEGWRAAMERAAKSPFLRGESGKSRGHENWRPDIEFFIKLENFVKLFEGKYDPPPSVHKPLTASELGALRLICLKDWTAGKPWISNSSGNGVWRDEYGVGAPPDDPRTLVTAEDLAAVPGARERIERANDGART